MNKEWESVASDFHGALWLGHLFAFIYFVRKPRFKWAAFHLVAAICSFIASKIHARDSR